MATMARTGMISVVHRFRSLRCSGLRKYAIVATEHSVWLTSTVNVATMANLPKPWADLLEYQMIRNSPTRAPSMTAAEMLATCGLFHLGWVRPRLGGKIFSRPITYRYREWVLWKDSAQAKDEVRISHSMTSVTHLAANLVVTA